MRKTSGQALVEFVMILPIFLLIVFGMIDFGKIMYQKFQLQNHLDIIKKLYVDHNELEITRYSNKEKINVSYQLDIDYTTITVTKKVDIITPILNHILKKTYFVEESVILLNEK